MTEQNFMKKLKKKFPDENYAVIHRGEKSNDISIIKCLDCGRKIQYRNSYLFSNKKNHLCIQCHYKRKDTIENEKIIIERLKNKADNIHFFMENRKGIRHNKVVFTCKNCGRVNEKEVANFLKQKFDCSYCEGQKEGKDTDIFTREMNEKYGENFSLLSEYVNSKTDVTIKCNKCGFIRKMKPNSFLVSGYCPKCGDKESKGEKYIKKYLDSHNIEYETQKYFRDWNIGIHYFDFYIPEYNYIIEFHGRQHYGYVDFFHKNQEDYEYRISKDKIKKEEALQHGLNYISIKYTLFSYLSVILDSLFNSTTIPQGSRGKCFEIETIQDLDEDIVCSSMKIEV